MRQEPEGFPEFWAIWRPHARHTDGRGLARETFAKHVRTGSDPQDIIDGARYFFRTLKERDREFVPLSATWMNRGSFEDLAVAERQYQQRVSEATARNEQASNVHKIDDSRRAELVRDARERLRRQA
jgi:hypothetical protein